ncbi:MAG: proton-conducting transporter membrane subunit, partial [Mycobacterium sp.]
DIERIGGGMLTTVPRLASLLTLATLASFGLPGLAGFWGEMLALLGAFQPAAGLSRGLFLVFMAAGGIGAVLTVAYFLHMLSRVTHGRVPGAWRAAGSMRDVMAGEYVAWAPLVVAIIVIGLWPALLLQVTNPAALVLVGGG